MSKRFNRSHAIRAIQRVDAGFVFPLPDTTKLVMGLPEDAEVPKDEILEARVKKLSIAKLAMIQGLSPTTQNAVLEVFEEIDRFAKLSNDDGELEDQEDIDAWTAFADGVMSQVHLRDGVCVAGFIDPPLCETREEAENDSTAKLVWVGALADTDKSAYLKTVVSPESEAAKALAPFPESGLESPSTDEVVSITTAPKRSATTKRGGGPK